MNWYAFLLKVAYNPFINHSIIQSNIPFINTSKEPSLSIDLSDGGTSDGGTSDGGTSDGGTSYSDIIITII